MQYQMPPELTKEERAMLNELPPLPTPAYGWNVDYYEGWQYIENPSERWHELLLFSEEQMRSYALEAVRLERERCARICEAYSEHLIAKGQPNSPSEWEAHGAEACANLISGNNEFGDPPESDYFAESRRRHSRGERVGR